MTQIIEESPVPVEKESISSLILDFYGALKAIADGKKVTRMQWEDASIRGYLNGDRLRINLKDGEHVWEICLADMLAEDWVVINE